MAKNSDKSSKEMPVWTDTKALVVELYKETNNGYFDSEPVMRNNIRRRGLNLLSNVSKFAEAYSLDSKIYFLNRAEENTHSLKSFNELASSLGAIKTKKYKQYNQGMSDIQSQLGKLIVTLRKRKKASDNGK